MEALLSRKYSSWHHVHDNCSVFCLRQIEVFCGWMQNEECAKKISKLKIENIFVDVAVV